VGGGWYDEKGWWNCLCKWDNMGMGIKSYLGTTRSLVGWMHGYTLVGISLDLPGPWLFIMIMSLNRGGLLETGYIILIGVLFGHGDTSHPKGF